MGTVVEKRKVKPDVFPYSCFIFICGGGRREAIKMSQPLIPEAQHYTLQKPVPQIRTSALAAAGPDGEIPL